jgi:PEP-CTERM motif
MSNVINLQVGVSVPLEYELVPFTYGLDKVTIVPEPATGALLAGALLAIAGCRRRR